MRAQQTVVSWEAILQNIAQAEVLGLTIGEVTDRIVNTLKTGAADGLKKITSESDRELLTRIAEDNVITISCKDGKNRNYNLEYYGELIARTATRQAETAGVKNTCIQYGNDLVEVSSHATACGECIPYEGKIFSISGASEDFPPLDDGELPPFHVNCSHVLLPVTIEGLEIRGTYDDMSEFSLDDEATFQNSPKIRELVQQ